MGSIVFSFFQEYLELLDRNRRADQVSLDQHIAHTGENFQLRIGLHPLSDYAEIQYPGKRNNHRDNCPGIEILNNVFNEGAVDLQTVDGQTFDIGERRIPGSKAISNGSFISTRLGSPVRASCWA